MIALTATDHEPRLFGTESDSNESLSEKQWIGATLIIIPPPRKSLDLPFGPEFVLLAFLDPIT